MADTPRLVNVSSRQIIEINADKFSVGRSLKCNYVLNSVYISRTHFILEKNNGRWILRDNSSNGTLLNGHMINYGKTKNLDDGDLIKLINADTEFRFEIFPSDNNSITDEQLCEALDSVVCVKNQVSEENVLNDHCYNVHPSTGQPVIKNEVIVSEDCNPPPDSIIPMPPDSSCSASDVSNQRKRLSSPENNACTQQSDESPSKKNKTDSTESISKTEEVKDDVPKPPDKEKKDLANNFDMVEEEMQCSICSELFIKAVTLNCCHTFCTYCIKQWKKQQSCCPICRKKITGMAPTLVLDNFIDKLVGTMEKEIIEQRKEIIEFRSAAEMASKGSGPSTSKKLPQTYSTNSVSTSTTATSHPTVTISSDEEEDGDEDYTDDYTDEDDYYDHYRNYNGVPGKYYGGYGRCYNCNRNGHWANGCPYR